jgi:uncharacterized protein
MEDRLSPDEKAILLKLARQALTEAVNGRQPLRLNVKQFPPRLQELGASFVTLTSRGLLRGCIGALEPFQALAQDVCEHAAAAALQDYRFPPVRPDELPEILIEISRLTIPEPLSYESPGNLLQKLRPGIDGVILIDGYRRATFLPQVWEKLPDKAQFLDHLCEKMGSPADAWRRRILQVSTYQVEEFHE